MVRTLSSSLRWIGLMALFCATPALAQTASANIAATAAPEPVVAGNSFAYTVTASNEGPDAALAPSLTFTLPAEASFQAITSPTGWNCVTPAIGSSGDITCNAAQLDVGSQAFTFNAQVPASIPEGSTLDASYSIATTTADPDTSDNAGTVSSHVIARAEPALTFTDSPDPVTPGATLTYTAHVSNVGPSDAANPSVVFTVPAQFAFDSGIAPGWTCAEGPPLTVTCSESVLPAASAMGVSIAGTVDPTLGQGVGLDASVEITSDTVDVDTSDNTGTAHTTTSAPDADLAITLDSTPLPVPGTTMQFSGQLQQNGPSQASTAQFSVNLPAETRFNAFTPPAGWSCSTPLAGAAGGSVSCSRATWDALDNGTYAIDVDLPFDAAGGSTFNASASISATTPDAAPANNTATLTVTVGTPRSDLTLTAAAAPDPFVPGTTLTFTGNLSQSGPSLATALSFTFPIPANTVFASFTPPSGWTCDPLPAVGAGGSVHCTLASLAPNAPAVGYALVVTTSPDLTQGSLVVGNPTLSSASQDPNPSDNSPSAQAAAGVPSADFAIALNDTPDPVVPGAALSYDLVATAVGPSTTLNPSVHMVTPAGTVFASFSAPAGWSCTTPAVLASGAIDCSAALLRPGAPATLTVVVTVDPNATQGSTISATATATSSVNADPVSGNNTATASTTVAAPEADLGVTAVASPTTVSPGDSIGVTVSPFNAGPSPASTVVLDIALPAPLQFESFTPAAGWSCTTPAVGSAGTVHCTIASLAGAAPPGEMSLTVSTASDAAGGLPLTVVATVSSATIDPNNANDSASASVDLLGPAQLSATKVALPTAVPGGSFAYTVTISNASPSAQADNPGDEFTDVLAAPLQLISASASSGTAVADLPTGTVHWNGTVPGNGSVTVTIVASVPEGTPMNTEIANQGTVFFDADGNGSNESSAPTDDPRTPAPADATLVRVGSAAGIPTLGPGALLLLGLLLGGVAALQRRRVILRP